MKRYSFLMAAAMLAVIGCEKSPEEINSSAEGNVYMQFSVKMLTTKSSTDVPGVGDSNSNADPDIEVGLDKENKISTVDIALVKGGKYFVSPNVKPVEATTDTYVASFNTLELEENATYKVYIYANCSAPASFAIDEVSEEKVANMTKDNAFWMTNAYAANEVTLKGLASHTTPQNPLNLGSHYVERSMARFDYMAAKANNTYDKGAGLSLTLTRAALINQSKNHYMFRRVVGSENTTGEPLALTNAVVGGVELPTSWVVDTDWAEKKAANFDAQLSSPNSWTWTNLSSLTANDNYSVGDYKIWCYAKENTLPGIKAQKHEVSTGVVFEAEITAGAGASQTVKEAMATGNRIYVFSDTLYGTWADVKTAALGNRSYPTLRAAYNQAIAGQTQEQVNSAVEPTAKNAADAGFTGYSAVKDNNNINHYYTYYYYWNRHNDNERPYEMGIMEFAVVRNNVYKLAVESISRFGHPTPPTDPTNPTDPDPDPVDPDDPDESVNYYFNVTVKVLPWTVRINNIEF